MKRVVQLLPIDGIGGVEVAARSLATGRHGTIQFERQYLVGVDSEQAAPGKSHGPIPSLKDPRVFIRSLIGLLREPPDLLVASLWRSAVVMILFKALRPSRKTAIFLHSAKTFHVMDKIFNHIAMILADEIWADSVATLDHRLIGTVRQKGHVVSFLIHRQAKPNAKEPRPSFIFWGRLNSHKGLRRALRIFGDVLDLRSDARFVLIGPDGGEKATLLANVEELGLAGNVIFSGPMSRNEIIASAEQASFYLQPSISEGMALSVVEAMQLGLVPIVTPVGEMGRYCRDRNNAIIISDKGDVAHAISQLLDDPARYKAMSAAAAEHWRSQPLYKDDFLRHAERLLT